MLITYKIGSFSLKSKGWSAIITEWSGLYPHHFWQIHDFDQASHWKPVAALEREARGFLPEKLRDVDRTMAAMVTGGYEPT